CIARVDGDAVVVVAPDVWISRPHHELQLRNSRIVRSELRSAQIKGLVVVVPAGSFADRSGESACLGGAGATHGAGGGSGDDGRRSPGGPSAHRRGAGAGDGAGGGGRGSGPANGRQRRPRSPATSGADNSARPWRDAVQLARPGG